MPANKAELSAFLKQSFPQANCHIESVGNGQAIVSHPIGDDELRPGGTVSGPVMMKVADVALYVAILGEIGIVPLAVTTNLMCLFCENPLHKPTLSPNASLSKLGARLR